MFCGKEFEHSKILMNDCCFLVGMFCNSAETSEWWKQDNGNALGEGAESLKRLKDVSDVLTPPLCISFNETCGHERYLNGTKWQYQGSSQD